MQPNVHIVSCLWILKKDIPQGQWQLGASGLHLLVQMITNSGVLT